MAYTTPSTVGGSDVLTAALWNTQIRDNFESMPRGAVGRASKTANQTGIGAGMTDLTGLTVTWTATASRLYLITVCLNTLQGAANSPTSIVITDSANNVSQALDASVLSGSYNPFCVSLYETGLTGSITRKVRALTAVNTMSIVASATAPCQILVQDMGLA